MNTIRKTYETRTGNILGRRTRRSLKEQIQKKLARGKSISVIAEEVEEEKSVIEQIIREMEENK